MSSLSPVTILARKMKDVNGTICKLETIIVEKIYFQIEQLSHMWNEVGIFENSLEDKCHTIADQVMTFMEDLVEDEENLIRGLKAGTDTLILKIISLSQDLDMSFDEPDERMTILEKKRVLTKLHAHLEEEKSARIKIWNELQKEIKESNILMKAPNLGFASSSTVPCLSDIEVLHMQADDVKWELHKRKKQMHELKQTIKRLVGELDHKVDQQDRIYLSDEVGDLLYSNENLKLHKTFVAKLEKIKKLNLSKIASYKEELKKSFEFKLEGEGTFREEDFGYFCPASGDLVKALKEQVLRRKQTIESTIRSKQTELRQWWEKCQVSCGHVDEKKDLLNGDLDKVDCSALKEELLVMESYYNNNKEILDLHKTFRDTFNDLSEAERKCINASRRLNNMGSTKEDKPRNKLLRDVAKIKQKLTSKVEHYENTTGTKFLFKGLHLSEYLEQMENQLQLNREAWKVDGLTPSSSRHSCCGNHILRTPTSQKKEEHFKNCRKSANRLSNRQQTPQDPNHIAALKKDSQSSNNGGKYGTDAKPPRPGTVVRRSAQSNQAVPRSARTKTCRPTSVNKAADTRIEVSEIENLDENFLNATASYEEFYTNLASNTSIISSSILENPKSPKKQRKRQFLMPSLYS